MGFKVDSETRHTDLAHPGDYRTEAHKALDEIIDQMESSESRGGEAMMTGRCAEGHTHVHRLTFSDFTGEKICVWCNGTGAEGS